jgi:hypothetical protein
MDLCRSQSNNFVYSKLGRFVILGFIRQDRPGDWQDTRVHLKAGRIEPRTYNVRFELFEYLNGRARRTAELLAGVSERQSKKIDETFRTNIQSYIGSDEFMAMQNDLRMFGDAAFIRPTSEKEEPDTEEST